ncbi:MULTISPECIES: beta-1,3-specific beta-L-arabinofuranosidase [Bifidobacterium]|uniref:beta-1,3-specific beta-L-arabinofuranosidase n=1 Tax=Bifidobacterium TaxID=1678 RepID=UPI001953B8DA|nr:MULTISPECIES: beta-L-arabinofuranosidase domain-containing protein [Bifidobacterium]
MDRKPSRWRRGVAMAATVPMLLALLPAGAAYAADKSSITEATTDANNVLSLGFNGNLNDDSTAGNAVAAYKGTPTYVDGVDGQAVRLDKGALSLGASQKLQPESLSLSFYWNPSATMTGEQILMWGKGKYNDNGWYLSSNSDSKPLVLSVGVGANGAGSGQPLEFNLSGSRADIFPANTWTHVMVTFDAKTKTAKFYINGEGRTATAGNTTSAGTIAADDTTKYIGWNGTHASGGQLTGSLDDVKLWSTVATTADVEREAKIGVKDFSAEKLAQAALDNVNITSKATANLTFNADAANGSALTYVSDNQDVVSNDGVVTRPAVGEKDATAKITVTSSYGSAAVSKTFTVTVPAQTDNGSSGDVEYLKNYLSEQGMENVTVSDSYLQNAGKKEVEYLLSFKPDRLLVEFRANAGLDTKGVQNYGGWENGPSGSRNPDKSNNPTRFTGHFVGHWISAASQAQRSTFATDAQKKELSANLTAVVKGIREAQEAYAKKDAANAGFFPAFSASYVPNGGGGLLVPFYNLHKIEAGMVQAYEYSTDAETRETAKDAAVDFAKYVVNWKAAHASTNMLQTEYGGMNDALYQVAEIANAEDKQTVLQAAHLFDETALFQKLANGQDVLNGLHANTTIPKLTGAMQRYVAYTEDQDLYNSLSADEQDKLTSLYLKAAKNFFDIVVNDHTYVNGGNSQSEHFHVADQLWKDATQNGDQNGGYRNFSTVETCNEYNMLKLARLLFQVTKDSKYSEYYEHTFINAIVASQNPETGMTMYFQPMKAGYPKVFGVSGTDYDADWFGSAIGEYWCCQGTGIENFAKLNDSFYFTDADNVYVNMFWSSTYTDKRHDLKIVQTANVPKQDVVTFKVSGSGSANLKLRVPEWAIASGVKLVVDGKTQELTKDANGWLTVAIRNGTEISYTLPAKLQAIDAADNKNWVAFQYGPVVLAGALTDTNYKTNYSYGGVKVRVANYDSDANAKAAVIPTDGQSVSEWLKGVSADGKTGNLVRTDKADEGNRETLTFKFKNVDGDAAGLELHPYYSTYKTTYAIYWDMAEVDSSAYQQNILKKKTDAATQSLITDAVDAFDNEFQQELAHNAAKSDDSNAGTYAGKQYRDAKANGWFSYDLKVTAGARNYLSTQYYSGDKGRTFSMIVDPTPVADNSKGEVSANAKTYTVTINDRNGANAFYWDTQELPADLVAQAKDGKVRVLFKSTGGLVGGVYGVRTQNAAGLNDDAALKSLKFSEGDLAPAFKSSKTAYTLTVPKNAKSVDATIGVKDAGSYVTVDGVIIDDTKDRTITLDNDVTTVDIASYAQDHKTVKYYTVTIVKDGAKVPSGDPVLEYTFDGDSASADANAVVDNTGSAGDKLDGKIVNSGATLADHDDNGKSLKVPGGNHGSSAYVTIPSGVVETGQKDITISADYQWDGANTCVYPWALGQNDKNYLVNIVSCGSNTRVEASKSGSQTQLTGSTPAKNTWVHVDVVVKGGKSISYYLDGKLVATKTTTLTAADFAGTTSASGYLGLSFYGSDKDFGGQIDNFKIWNRAVGLAELFPGEDGDEPAEATVESIKVTKQPAKTTYTVGDKFDADGLEVTAVMSDKTEKVLDAADYTVSGFDGSKAGKQTLTVKLKADETKTATFDVTVEAKKSDDSSLKSLAVAGVALTADQLKAAATADGTTVKVADPDGVTAQQVEYTLGATAATADVTVAKDVVTVVVTAENGSKTTYTVKLEKAEETTPVKPTLNITGDGVDGGRLTLKIGAETGLNVTVKGDGVDVSKLDWKIADEKVVGFVDMGANPTSDRRIKGLKAGETTVTVTDPTTGASAQITVTVPAEGNGGNSDGNGQQPGGNGSGSSNGSTGSGSSTDADADGSGSQYGGNEQSGKSGSNAGRLGRTGAAVGVIALAAVVLAGVGVALRKRRA